MHTEVAQVDMSNMLTSVGAVGALGLGLWTAINSARKRQDERIGKNRTKIETVDKAVALLLADAGRHNVWIDEHEKQITVLEKLTEGLKAKADEVFRRLDKMDDKLDEIVRLIRNGHK